MHEPPCLQEVAPKCSGENLSVLGGPQWQVVMCMRHETTNPAASNEERRNQGIEALGGKPRVSSRHDARSLTINRAEKRLRDWQLCVTLKRICPLFLKAGMY